MKLVTAGHPGLQNRTVTVYTNIPDRSQAVVVLTIKADVWEPVTVAPRSLVFRWIGPDPAQPPLPAQMIQITNNTSDPLKIENMHFSTKGFQTELKELEAGKKYQIAVSLDADAKPGPLTGTLTFSTGSVESPAVTVPLSAYIGPELSVTPGSVMLPVLRPGMPVPPRRRELQVRHNGNKEFEIRDLAVTNPAIQVTVVPIQPKRSYRLVIEWPEDYQPPPIGDRITFKTDHPGIPQTTIPVTQMRMPTGQTIRPPSLPTTSTPVQVVPRVPASQPAVRP